MEDLFNLCASDDLSLLALQKMLGSLPSSSNNNNDLHEYPFIHEACMNNKEVTFEIVDCLMQQFPNAAQVGSVRYCPGGEITSYPIHVACRNKKCSSAVIELLINKYPDALQHSCIANDGVPVYDACDCISGLPLHYYLSRGSNVDIR